MDPGFRTVDVESFGVRIAEFSEFGLGIRMLNFRVWRMILNAAPGL